MEKKHIPLSPTLELVTVLSGCLGFSNQSLYTGRGSHIQNIMLCLSRSKGLCTLHCY
jgi:hypothetical protein